mmetsp:Transcript_22215/g.68395  ORF Transcript_22215/g.68395 Transcript_22215/m.68395 type:complete len:125 (-) Transcript_22215:126-500(-)|eukprot:CAMPEP_0198644444 /NCGR_PEP_ID=MMETSP1467-20131203/621_1 /TAXON_ID=1462469 /ORGANISM="unid. sp., Strain CCMP2135" /LENGTH=124 /DNA_ID=CAMNT_0044379901 /DNA_START=65 /DNA_END=439 /DNA_ORIENTATION=+
MASSADGLLGETEDKSEAQQPQSGKNAVLVGMLIAALVLTGVGVHCERAPHGCEAVVRVATPRHLLYAGLLLVVAWCCCPCFKLDCQDVENRSCFLRAIQRRRRLRRARALGVPSAAQDEEEEP